MSKNYKSDTFCGRKLTYANRKKHEKICPKNPINDGNFNGVCKFCKQDGFVKISSLHYHENRCFKNPNRVSFTFSGKSHSIETKRKQGKSFKGKKPKELYDVSSRTISKILMCMKAKCHICGWDKTTIDLHHIISRADGGTDEISNLTPVCPNCHRMIHHGIINSSSLLSFKDIYGETWKDFYYSL